MEAEYEPIEIVYVLGGFKLVDCESYERQYARADARPLAPGYYRVSWPEDCRNRRFNIQARFEGPFRNRQEARAILEQEAYAAHTA